MKDFLEGIKQYQMRIQFSQKKIKNSTSELLYFFGDIVYFPARNLYSQSDIFNFLSAIFNSHQQKNNPNLKITYPS